MRSIAGYLFGGFITLGLIIAAFVFSIRSCLSKYDQRYALQPALYFGKGDTAIIFSLIKFSETTSYSQEGGFIMKTFKRSYLIQNNRIRTGEKIASRKIRGNENISHYPETILGATSKQAWIFLDELLSFDAVTLEKIADKRSIEDLNPVLKGKLPKESQYYHFNEEDKNIRFTANDGSLWILDTKTLKASPDKTEIKPTAMRHSDFQERLKRLLNINISFNEMAINLDTANGKWFGMYATEEINKEGQKVPPVKAYGQDERRQFYTGSIIEGKKDFTIKNEEIKLPATELYFLDAGFLLDSKTALPIRLPDPGSYLIVYKSQVGYEGKIILARIAQDGKLAWKMDTGLRDWIDWNYTGQYFLVFGNNRKELSNPACSLLLIIDVASGKIKQYDYFKDKAGDFIQQN